MTLKGRTPDPGPQTLVRVGQKVSVKFRSFDLDGAGVAAHGAQKIAVPFALPGEEAVIEITAAKRSSAAGKIAALVRKSPSVVEPRCRHFGRCGGCQWQHLPYEMQLAAKTGLVRQALVGIVEAASVRDAVGGDPWEYRSRLQATLALRRDRPVAGFYGVGDRVVINVQECPIQHPANVRILLATRAILVDLRWPVYDPDTEDGLLRGIIIQSAFATGEGMLVLCATAAVPDRMAFVRAAIDRVPELRSVLLSVRKPRTAELLGRTELLWGRPYIADVLGDGLRVNLYASPSVPPNPRALTTYLAAIRTAAGPATSAIDVSCDEGLVPVALSLAPSEGSGAGIRKMVGVVSGRESMRRAWENAKLNGADGCVFYTRAPEAIMRKLRGRGQTFDVLLVSGRQGTITPVVAGEAAASGCRRIIYAGSSMTRLHETIRAAGGAGYRLTDVQPVDLLPQTARVHVVATLTR